MLHEIIVKGQPLPIAYATKVFNQLSNSIQAKHSFEESITTPTIDMNEVVELTALALNEGARKSKIDKRYTFDEVIDMIDDEPSLYGIIFDLYNEGVSVCSAGFNRIPNSVPTVVENQ